jgi:hypothetical protein
MASTLSRAKIIAATHERAFPALWQLHVGQAQTGYLRRPQPSRQQQRDEGCIPQLMVGSSTETLVLLLTEVPRPACAGAT